MFEEERQHWIATSYMGGEVRLYDSASTGTLKPSIERQLVQLYRSAVRDGQLMVTLTPFQQQLGNRDCGLFSIAAAYDAAAGRNLSTASYDQDRMRSHLEECIEKEHLSQFPSAMTPVHRCKLKHLFVHIYCVCGLPESFDSKMVECEDCQRWYHFKCVGLTEEPGSWMCSDCTK